MITVANCSKAEEAHLIRIRLEAGGVEAFVQDEFIVQMDWLYANAVGGIKVQINEADEERAKEILGEEPYDTEKRHCPHCGSDRVQLASFTRKAALLSVVLLGIPLLFRRSTFNCLDCKSHWKLGQESSLD